ncbi:MAG: prolipoprotein diacylglyceryl transferase [Calditrichaeota bacterium]|nr:prolipoprotein diacylglyceryl transferase [Calditrichota bacterium]RQW07670.1 MAG: prolipoprotein diacylglyceryl transferase [Calditrichota bacterium]
MHPELFRIGPFAVHSYGVMLALSFILGIYVAVRKGEKRGVNGDAIVNLGFIIIIASIVGARLFYVLFHTNEFTGRWIYAFWPVQEDGTVGLGGLILLGGFITAVLASVIYIYIKKMNFWKLADSVAPSIALGVFLTRIGCYLNGCCFGTACEQPWGVLFPAYSPAGATMVDVYIHPTQLYSAFYGLVIFAVLLWLDRRPFFDGLLIGSFLVLYGIARFIVDFYRYYESQMFIIAGLQFNQVVSLLMFIAGIIILFIRRKYHNKPKVLTH